MSKIKEKIKVLLQNDNLLSKFIVFAYNLIFSKLLYVRGSVCDVNIANAFCKCSKVRIKGNDNRISVGRFSRLVNCRIIIIGGGNSLIIKDNCRLNNTTLWLEDNNNCITIGDNTTMEGGSIAATEGTHIILGNDCMLSFDVDIRSGDSHGIFSSDKGRLNPAGNIMIGNHVWVGAKATILKEAAIPDGCIIGHSSLVTKKFTSQRSIYAGNPAKFIKENIIWSRNKQLE